MKILSNTLRNSARPAFFSIPGVTSVWTRLPHRARAALHHPLRSIYKLATRIWERLPRSRKSRWRAGKAAQLRFWRKWFETMGLHWPEDYRTRVDPEAPLQDQIIASLESSPFVEVRLLDVGAGPLTLLGKRWPGRLVCITAVDPLADDYNKMLDGRSMAPIVRTQRGEVERLSELFAPNQFDLVYMRNALDHSYDPLLGIRQMLRVVKPGGWVFLHHTVNEGENEKYHGMHQWNFMDEDGEFIVWNRRGRISVNDALREQAHISIERTVQDGEDWITVKLQKSARSNGDEGH